MCDHTYDSDNIYSNDPIDQNNQNDSETCDLTESKDSDQLLIDLVRLYPHLWDKQKKDFKDTAKKETSWEEISSILNQSTSICQSKWQRLRQYYAKERQKQELESRSGSKAVNRMPWYLFSSMNFLDSHMYKRRTFTNFKKSVTSEKSQNSINDNPRSRSVSPESCTPSLDETRDETSFLKNSNSVPPLNSSKVAKLPKLAIDSVQRPSSSANISTKSRTPSLNSTSSFNNRDPFVDLTNSPCQPLHENSYTKRPSPAISPQINTSLGSTPSPKSTSSTRRSISSGNTNVDCFIDSFEAVSSSIIQLSNRVKEKQNEGKDHALANLVLKELQAAEEPKKSMLRKKIMEILMDHMNNS